MPSLFRFLLLVGLLAGLVYGGMVALVTFVKVQPREMTQTVTLPKPREAATPAAAPAPAATPAPTTSAAKPPK